MTSKSLNMAISAVLTIGLAVPAIAQKTETTSDKPYAPGQVHWGNMCSIASEGDAVTIDAQFSGLFANGSDEATVALAVKKKGKGGSLVSTYDVVTMKGRAASGAPAQACDTAPVAEDHAIQTKGAGGERTMAEDHAIKTKGAGGDRTMAAPTAPEAEEHAINTKGAGANDRTIGVRVLNIIKSCTVSGDASNPVISISVVVPMPSGKATITDLNFMSVNSKRTSASEFGESPGAGGMAPHVKDAFVCTTASGEASDVTALLLPAIQK